MDRSRLRWVAAAESNAGEAGLSELLCHESGMVDGNAEAERPHSMRVEHDPLYCLDQLGNSGVVVAQQVAQFLNHIAAAPPRDVSQIGLIRDAEVLKRHQEPLIYRFPESELDRDSL